MYNIANIFWIHCIQLPKYNETKYGLETFLSNSRVFKMKFSQNLDGLFAALDSAVHTFSCNNPFKGFYKYRYQCKLFFLSGNLEWTEESVIFK